MSLFSRSNRILMTMAVFWIPTIVMAQGPFQSKSDQNPDVTIELLVAEADDAARQAEKILKDAGGKIDKRSINRDQYDNQSATFSASIPMESVDGAMDKIRKIGSVRSENSDFDSSVKTVRVRIMISDKRMDSYGDSRSQGRLFAGVAAAVFFTDVLAGAFFVALTLAILISLQICGTEPL